MSRKPTTSPPSPAGLPSIQESSFSSHSVDVVARVERPPGHEARRAARRRRSSRSAPSSSWPSTVKEMFGVGDVAEQLRDAAPRSWRRRTGPSSSVSGSRCPRGPRRASSLRDGAVEDRGVEQVLDRVGWPWRRRRRGRRATSTARDGGGRRGRRRAGRAAPSLADEGERSSGRAASARRSGASSSTGEPDEDATPPGGASPAATRGERAQDRGVRVDLRRSHGDRRARRARRRRRAPCPSSVSMPGTATLVGGQADGPGRRGPT